MRSSLDSKRIIDEMVQDAEKIEKRLIRDLGGFAEKLTKKVENREIIPIIFSSRRYHVHRNELVFIVPKLDLRGETRSRVRHYLYSEVKAIIKRIDAIENIEDDEIVDIIVDEISDGNYLWETAIDYTMEVMRAIFPDYINIIEGNAIFL